MNNRLPVGPLTKHEVVQLRIKDMWAGGHGPIHMSRAASDEDMAKEHDDGGDDEPAAGGGSVPRTHSGASFGGGARSSTRDSEQPRWAAKLTRKVKKLFCFHTDIQHKMYQAHKKEKENRKLQKDF